MKTRFYLLHIKSGILIGMVAFLLPLSLQAQRMGHRPGGGGGQQSMSRPAGNAGRSINGGNQNSQSRKSANPGNVSNDRGTLNKESGVNRGDATNRKPGGKDITTGDKTKIGGDKVNIDNSKKNVNVNVDKSKNVNVVNNRNTVVRGNSRPYPRPPYAYGGHRYYCYHPYYYHPYHPYYWGPVYHPWGFFVAAIATTAIIISIENQQYHYDQGIYYMSSNGGYTVVQAPVGATITTLPENTQTVVVNETTTNYYYGGTYYEKNDKGYEVVPPTAGCVVENLPDGGKEVKIGDVTYTQVGETYYQPIQKDGKNMYEVVEVKAEE
jgi:hypothetical protein